MFVVPAYPTENVLDPTGAGDSFAGGLLGCLESDHSHPRAGCGGPWPTVQWLRALPSRTSA